MARVKNVLRHVKVETAKARRKCHRKQNEHSITKGQVCLVVTDAGSGGKRNYCDECAGEILDLANETLAQIRQALRS